MYQFAVDVTLQNAQTTVNQQIIKNKSNPYFLLIKKGIATIVMMDYKNKTNETNYNS